MTVENRIRAIMKLQERYEVSLREAKLLFEEGFYGSANEIIVYLNRWIAENQTESA